MISANTAYVGIDPTFGDKDFSYAILDGHLNLVRLAEAEMAELRPLLAGYEAAFVAVNAPSGLNRGLVKEKLKKERSDSGRAIRGVDLRLAEYELRERGISITGTPSRETFCPAWMRSGFRLHRELSAIGFKPFGSGQTQYLVIEAHPHAAFCGLAGSIPLPRTSLMGRIQRQLLLGEMGLRITDGMNFFQEITRFRLMKGILPEDLLYSPEQLDLLAAACMAWLAYSQPDEVILVGDSQEGQIAIPARDLKEKY